ncbi:MAG: hypothetical protein ACRD1R_18910 [Acidobacteriota bacterium]
MGNSERGSPLYTLEFKSSDIQEASGIQKAVERIGAARQPVVLVEAMGQSAQQLLKAAEKAARQDLVLASTLAEGLRTYHMQVAQQVTSNAVWKQTKAQLSSLFEEISSLLQGLYLLGEFSPHGKRVAGFYAERSGAIILSQALHESGRPSQSFAAREAFLSVDNAGRESIQASLRAEIDGLLKELHIPVLPASLGALIFGPS